MTEDLLTIDPGDNTGWAFWQNKVLVDYGQIQIGKKFLTTFEQYTYLWREFKRLTDKFVPDVCIIEGVEVFSGSITSHIAVRKRQGQQIASLFKLAYLIGGYICICIRANMEVKVVSYPQWAGQLTNKAVKAQIKHILGVNFKTQHITDAVGIGLNNYGRL